jgi:hypothetical protein
MEAGKRHGKYMGRTAFDAACIPRYLDEGFLFFTAPSELSFMAAGVKQYFGLAGLGEADPQPARRAERASGVSTFRHRLP